MTLLDLRNPNQHATGLTLWLQKLCSSKDMRIVLLNYQAVYTLPGFTPGLPGLGAVSACKVMALGRKFPGCRSGNWRVCCSFQLAQVLSLVRHRFDDKSARVQSSSRASFDPFQSMKCLPGAVTCKPILPEVCGAAIWESNNHRRMMCFTGLLMTCLERLRRG